MELNELRRIAEAATPGPWHWAGNADNHQLYLATWIKGAGRCQVMDFERWGMQGAIPRFLDDESLMMQTAKNRLVFEVARNQGLPDGTPRSHPKVYRADVVDVMHPNAEFIATFDPPTVLALLSRLEQAEQQRDSSREACKTLAEVLSNHSEWIVEATDSQDLIGEDGDGDWDVVWDRVMELGEAKRKAEQAVARVREFSDQMLKPHGQNVVVAARVRERLAEILDGDGRG